MTATFARSPCPTPNKLAYDTRSAARYAERQTGLTKYRCECGRYHLTKSRMRPLTQNELDFQRYGVDKR
jgi:hypothetical protein